MTRRSSSSFAIGGASAGPICIVCGAETPGHHFLDVRSFCEAHCPDHDWDYDRYRRGHFCLNCDAEKEYEPSDDDVGFGSYQLDPGEPIGTPISELATRPDGTVAGQRRYENWLRLSERCGYP